MTWSNATVPLAEKNRTHGDIATQAPAARTIHSCHSAKIASATTASAAIRMPLNQAFQFVGLSAANSKTHGDANKPSPITRLTASAIVSFFQSLFMISAPHMDSFHSLAAQTSA